MFPAEVGCYFHRQVPQQKGCFSMNAALKNQIRTLEERLLAQQTRLNSAELGEMLAEGFVEFGASGIPWTRDSVLDALPIQAFVQRTISNFEVRLLAEDVVLATYRCSQPSVMGEIESLRSSIWKRCNGCWRMEFHQGTRTRPIPLEKGGR